jgi:trigger factor
MKVTQEVLPDSQVGLEIEIPSELSQRTYDQVLNKLMSTTSIPGFRKGKVPKPVFLQRIGVTQFKATVLQELLETAIQSAIKQEEITAIGNYQLRSSFEDLVAQYQPGQILTIFACVDVPPRVTLKQYKGFSLQVEEVLPDPERVNQTLATYQNQRATLVPVEDRPTQMGDAVVIDFVGKVANESGDLEEFAGGSGADFSLDLEPGRFIPGFIEGIVGMNLEESKDLDLAFPEDYGHADLAGKAVIFSITLKEVKEKELPELDDDFAQEISEFPTIEELRSSLEDQYAEEASERTKTNQHAALLNALVANLEVEIPETLVQQETDFLVRQTLSQVSQQGLDLGKFLTQDLVEGIRKETRPNAIERLKRTLALGEVAKQEAISVTPEELQTKFDQTLADLEDPDQYDLERLRQVLEEELLQDRILTWLLTANTLELVSEGSLEPEPDSNLGTEASNFTDAPPTASSDEEE